MSCSKKKLPVPAPAKYLYSASPLFSLNYNAAELECERVFIVSAKHGLLDPEQWVTPYDFALSQLSQRQKQEWTKGIRVKLPDYKRLEIYAGGDYWELLKQLPKSTRPCEGDMFTRAKELGMGKRLKPHYWPMNWILQTVYSSGKMGVPTGSLEKAMRAKEYSEPTVKAQLDRAARCAIHILEGSRIYSGAIRNPCLGS